MGKKNKVSSPTTGNPYGRTGAPGKATEPKPNPAADARGVEQMIGRPLAQPPPVERRLLQAPPPKPQTPNLNALKMRGAKPPIAPPMRNPQEQAALQGMYSTYMPLPDQARGGTRDMAPQGAPPPGPPPVAWDRTVPPPPGPAQIPTLAETQQARQFTQGQAPAGDAVVPRAMPAGVPVAPGRVRRGSDVNFYEPERPVNL